MTELEKAAREALETLEALKKHGDIAVVVAPEREYRLPEVIVALRTTIEQAETAQGQVIDWTATWSHGRFAYEIEQLLKEKNA